MIRFFQILNLGWKVPSPAEPSDDLLEKLYDQTLAKAFEKLRAEGEGTLWLYGATDNLSRSPLNEILHTPLPYFIECLKGDLKRENTRNVVSNIEDAIMRINEQAGFQWVHIFKSDSCNGMPDVRKKRMEKN